MSSVEYLSSILKELVKIYNSVYGDKIVRIILYGSYARGDFTEESDIDVAAIVQGNREKLQNDLRKVWEVSANLELEYGVIVSPTVIPFDEFEKYQNILPYYRNIRDEGVEIVA